MTKIRKLAIYEEHSIFASLMGSEKKEFVNIFKHCEESLPNVFKNQVNFIKEVPPHLLFEDCDWDRVIALMYRFTATGKKFMLFQIIGIGKVHNAFSELSFAAEYGNNNSQGVMKQVTGSQFLFPIRNLWKARISALSKAGQTVDTYIKGKYFEALKNPKFIERFNRSIAEISLLAFQNEYDIVKTLERETARKQAKRVHPNTLKKLQLKKIGGRQVNQ